MNKKFKIVWNYLNGKKVNIGMLLILLSQGISAFFPELMTQEQINFLLTIGSVIGGGGMIHKMVKTETAQKIIRSPPKSKMD